MLASCGHLPHKQKMNEGETGGGDGDGDGETEGEQKTYDKNGEDLIPNNVVPRVHVLCPKLHVQGYELWRTYAFEQDFVDPNGTMKVAKPNEPWYIGFVHGYIMDRPKYTRKYALKNGAR